MTYGTLMLMQYNNYFNRKVLKQDTIEGYQAQAVHFSYLSDTNFIPNDGVITKHVINWNNNWSPDYLIYINSNNEIVSRWFVTESVRLRTGQYQISLKRDTVADFLEVVKQSPIFLEKGTISSLSNKLIYNNEDFACNEIKKQEILLYDKTQCPWLVVYLSKDWNKETKTGSFGGSLTADYQEDTIDDFDIYHDYGEGKNTPFRSWNKLKFITHAIDYASRPLNNVYDFIMEYSKNGNKSGHFSESILGSGQTNLFFAGQQTPQSVTNKLFLKYLDNFNNLANFAQSEFSLKTSTELQGLLDYDGKILLASNSGTFYRIRVIQKSTSTKTHNFTGSSNLKTTMNNYWNDISAYISVVASDSSMEVISENTDYEVRLEPIIDATTITWTSSGFATNTNSGLYDVICMPYGNIRFKDSSNNFYYLDKELSIKALNNVTSVLTSAFAYDYQILPYCPIPDLISSDVNGPYINIPSNRLKFIENNNEIASAICCPETIINNMKIFTSVEFDGAMPDYNSIFNVKLMNDCYKYRLCSPNYNGVFEFNLARNGGTVDFFDVDMVLRPQIPYIHVNPNFSELYGRDFNDSRGLICSGDFSVGILDNAWRQYEIQNKNFQSLFDRQIQNMDVNFAYKYIENGLGGIGSLATSVLNPNPVGKLAGGMGAVVGLEQAIMQPLKYAENRDYATDIHNYQLDNIKALPNSITKSNPLTGNNKLVPFIEVYSCSDEEKEAFMNKLTYDGMTISKITTISEYVGGFIKGQLIRLDGISEDSHILQDIYNEIAKGVFMYE